MIRKLLLGFGVVEILKPRPIIELCEKIGLENPEEAELRSRALGLARLEGLLFVWLLLKGRRDPPLARAILGAVGALAVVYPKPLIRFSQSFAYENPTDLELKRWVEPAARLLGCLYLLVVALSAGESDGTESNAETETVEPIQVETADA